MSEESWTPWSMLVLLACGFAAAVALAVVIAATGGEPFAIGLAVFGALIMAIGAALGFGPLRRV